MQLTTRLIDATSWNITMTPHHQRLKKTFLLYKCSQNFTVISHYSSLCTDVLANNLLFTKQKLHHLCMFLQLWAITVLENSCWRILKMLWHSKPFGNQTTMLLRKTSSSSSSNPPCLPMDLPLECISEESFQHGPSLQLWNPLDIHLSSSPYMPFHPSLAAF